MAFEFKKLSDVNSIEAMKEGLNILAEDNGEIVKVQTPYYGITVQLIDGSALVPGLITYQMPYTMEEIVDWLRNAINMKVEFIRLNLQADGSSISLYQTGYELISVGDGNYNARVFFGDNICPIILDIVENKMILDPDWTAPAESIPVPATAEVGQVIAVKAVDENGKPTEWEAVDAGGGLNVNGTSNIINMTLEPEGNVVSENGRSFSMQWDTVANNLSIDKTYEEVKSMVDSGNTPIVKIKQYSGRNDEYLYYICTLSADVVNNTSTSPNHIVFDFTRSDLFGVYNMNVAIYDNGSILVNMQCINLENLPTT